MGARETPMAYFLAKAYSAFFFVAGLLRLRRDSVLTGNTIALEGFESFESMD